MLLSAVDNPLISTIIVEIFQVGSNSTFIDNSNLDFYIYNPGIGREGCGHLL
jgi:hypothetical protein